MPIIVVGLVSQVAIGLIATANELFDLKASQDIETILIVVLFGIGTDYILFFLFRYRERLREGEEKRPAVAHALERAGEAIASAGGAVIVAFMALVLSLARHLPVDRPGAGDRGGGHAARRAHPGAGGRDPARAARSSGRRRSTSSSPRPPGSRAVGRSVGRHPGRYALASGGGAGPAGARGPVLQPHLRPRRSSGTSDDRRVGGGAQDPREGLPRRRHRPDQVLLHSTDGEPLDAGRAHRVRSRRWASSRASAQVRPGAASEDGTDRVVQRRTSTDDPASDAAIAAVKGPIRDAAHAAAPDGTEALVGGTTSVFVDFQAAMNRDYKVVFPVAAIVIMIILALLLRSLVAPLVPDGRRSASASPPRSARRSIVFQNIQGDAGLIFLLPIYVYLFVVALGTDYNILMIARLREEAREGLEPRDAAAEAIKHAGPTIAAAGVILAGTFASLMLAGNSFFTVDGLRAGVRHPRGGVRDGDVLRARDSPR